MMGEYRYNVHTCANTHKTPPHVRTQTHVHTQARTHTQTVLSFDKAEDQAVTS